MEIVFEKVGSTPKPIEINHDGLVLKGTLEKSGYHQVTLDAQLDGCLALGCDRCGETFDSDIHTQLKLKLSDRVSEDKDDLDIIEFLDGKIDILYILQSEINTFKSTYNYCPNCDNDQEDFEVEF